MSDQLGHKDSDLLDPKEQVKTHKVQRMTRNISHNECLGDIFSFLKKKKKLMHVTRHKLVFVVVMNVFA